MNHLERKQIKLLQNEKNRLCDEFIGACQEINKQIDDVRSGKWLQEITKIETDRQEGD